MHLIEKILVGGRGNSFMYEKLHFYEKHASAKTCFLIGKKNLAKLLNKYLG